LIEENPKRGGRSKPAAMPGVSVEEDIPWKCARHVIGTGAYGSLPVMKEVKREAKRHKVKLLILPTCDAIEVLKKDPEDTNAILHVTC
jgi:hypothetical protein